jgi:vacuolar-type H+-ATPase subunit E/Vma4
LVDNESVDKICSQIIQDGDRERESILGKAEETASGIIEKAEGEARHISEKLLREAEERGELERRRLLSSVNLEIRRAKLRAREEVVAVVQEKVTGILQERRERGDYAGILTGLIAEAIEALDGDRFVVHVDRRDVELLEKRVFAAVRDAAAKSGRKVEHLDSCVLEKSTLGGARVGVPGGNVIYDNTFEARMYRLRDEIRNIIFEEVFSSPESEE